MNDETIKYLYNECRKKIKNLLIGLTTVKKKSLQIYKNSLGTPIKFYEKISAQSWKRGIRNIRSIIQKFLQLSAGPSLEINNTDISTNAVIRMNGNKIINVGNPVNLTDAVNLKYLNDNYVALGDPSGTSGYLKVTGGTMTGNLNMGGNSIINLATPTDAQTNYAANVAYVLSKTNSLGTLYTPLSAELATNTTALEGLSNVLSPDDPLNSAYLWVTGGTMIGNINMNNHTITGLPETLTDPSEAVSLKYLNNNYLALSGGTMTGVIDMSSNSITNIATPSSANTANAANVEFVFQRLLFKTNTAKGASSAVGLSQSMAAGEKFNWTWVNTPSLQTPNQSLFFNTVPSGLSLELLQRALYILSWTVTFTGNVSSNFILNYTNPGASITNQTIGYYPVSTGRIAQLFCQIPIETPPQAGALPILEITSSSAVTLNTIAWQICACNIS